MYDNIFGVNKRIEMEQLITGKTNRGTFYVRPIGWAGVWDKNGTLCEGNTLYESERECDCESYINRQKLIMLVANNPELPVIPMVSYDCVADDCGYWLSRFGNVEIGEIYVGEEKVYIRDKDDWNDIFDDISTAWEVANLSDEEAEKKVDSLDWKKGIIVYIESDV